MYKCPGCGAALRFSPEHQLLTCDHCGQFYDPRDPGFDHMNEAESEAEVGGENADIPVEQQDDSYLAYVYKCPNCGAKLLSTDETAATFCSFCGSNVALESALDREEKPDVVIPFKVSKEACEKAYRKTLKRAWFVPSAMKQDTQIEKFRGIYMPYWIYDYELNQTMSVPGETSYRMGDYVYHKHYSVTSSVTGEFGGISYDASSSFSDTMSEAVAPFSADAAETFDTTYLSGFYADVTDVDKHVYERSAREVASDYFTDRAFREQNLSSYGVKRSDVRSNMENASDKNKKGYYPVWFLANRSKDGKSVSYAVVNGESGKVAADLPVSFWKYLLASLLTAIPIAAALWWYFTTSTESMITPKGVLIIMAIFSVVMMIITSSELRKAEIRGNLLNDKGYLYKVGSINTDLMQKKKAGSNWKSIVSIIIAVGVLIWAPIGDFYYYLAGFAVIALQIWSVLDLIRIQNRQAQQKPPQFEKRGGDFDA